MAARDGDMRLIAGLVTLSVHLVVIGGVWAATTYGSGTRNIADQPRTFPVIEAGLARLAQHERGHKTKQAQRVVEHKVAPEGIKVSHQDTPIAAPKPPERKPVPPPEEIDPEAVFNKHREGSTGAIDPASADPGTDEESKAGQVDGSQYGTLDHAQGDPYLGELVGRMTEHYEVPGTVEQGLNLRTQGCVKLNEDGSIADSFLDESHKSRSPAFNSAVLRSVKQTSNMGSPVPVHLKKMLMEDGACATFKY
jgi:hypothetical protein